jgi:hypothetical protein
VHQNTYKLKEAVLKLENENKINNTLKGQSDEIFMVLFQPGLAEVQV